ncbi:phage tail sheath subtilisin-like domain-containing protein [Jeongeupia sp. USM3]|uniref:phage tail sheath subtilisin-like domain-containing protein n=1 Tax=Jeongeupia sp. USM3 TaxID=1906741 RepID=UPI00089DFF1C|nr:phage tail sheath subtilisin-like domain-containing protein [Jeongeupia sp. USM3]AOY00101.1 phage tail protein [Jeongeupia sp. USM3]
MSVAMATIPSNQLVPLFYAEMDNSAAGYFENSSRILVLGHALTGAPIANNQLTLTATGDQAVGYFGRGSMLARMVDRVRRNNAGAEIWTLAVAEPAGGAAATGTITITGVATEAGVLTVYLAGQRVQAGVAKSDAAAAAATALAAAINASADLPVTASATAGAVTWTARHKGLTGSDIVCTLNLRGAESGERTPGGLTVALAAGAAGAGSPDLSPTIAAMGDELFDAIVLAWSDAATTDAFKLLMNDQTGRWSYAQMLYGHVWAAQRGTLGALVTAGGTRNDQHLTVAGMETQVQSPAWEYAAAYGGACTSSLFIDPARPTQTLPLLGTVGAPRGQRFIMQERQSLLSAGIATSMTGSDGTVMVERSVTSYRVNAWGQPDPSYRDVETLYTSSYVLRDLRYTVTQKYGRHKLAKDGTRFGPGQAIVTPSMIRAELIARYAFLEEMGVVEDSAGFAENLVVEIDASNPNRVNILFPPNYVNQLRIVAVRNQFRS